MNLIYECDDLDYRGYGVSKSDQKVSFIKGLLPGEKALVKITKEYRNYQEGEVIEILQFSNSRKATNNLDHMPLSHLKIADQIKFQARITKETIENSLKTKIEVSSPIYDQHFNYYRNKATYQVENRNYLRLGIFQENSHNLIEIDHDLLVLPLINQTLDILINYYRQNKLESDSLKQIVIKASPTEVMVIFKTSDNQKIDERLYSPLLKLDFIKSIYQSYETKNKNEKVFKLIYGFSYITTKIADFSFLNYPDSFFQVNHYLTKSLYDEIKKNIKGSVLIDAYAGMSTISIYLADKFETIYSLEINSDAVKSAKNSLRLNQINNVKIIKGDVKKTLNDVDRKSTRLNSSH